MGETEKIETHRIRCFSKLKMFLLAITCAFISKTLSGSYMNSMLTQIERQFNIPTSLVGFINGSFEIGNLFLIIFVSYFGTKFHRPRMIGVGCAVMGLGCFLQSLPHFLMDRYEYESTVLGNLSSNSFLCNENGTQIFRPTEDPSAECVKEVKSLMWVYVLVGNMIRGIGETPIMPLGISYIEDFAKSENSPLYIGFVETGAIIGPLFGLLLASFCANVYVDIGSVNTDELTITPIDTRWVGAWWFGILICAGVNVLTAIPFFFLPKTLAKEGSKDDADIVKNDNEEKQKEVKKENDGITKDFLPFMKSLFSNPVYMLFMLISVVQFNAFINMMFFMPKYVEQQYGKSTSEAIFLIGIYNLPPICIGYIFGGLMMKKFKITVKQAAHIACYLSFIDFLLYFSCFFMVCDNSSVAGITTDYKGMQQDLHIGNAILDNCNMDCNCPTKTWDPVCGSNGLSYMSACLAGCETFVGTGLNMVFHNCSCIQTLGNSSAVLGLCDKGHDCSMMLQYFLILSSVSCFIYSLSAIPGYMVLLRCIKPEEKSLGVGLHAFSTRVFAGIPAPIYFGALMDSTCLHWATFKCGESGACRIYESTNFRYLYLGLPAALRGLSYIPAVFILIILRKYRLPGENTTSGTLPAEAKVTGNEDQEMDQTCKVLNNNVLNTKM
ncbi:PREDICTED: solute carrier organic anion transporter family member 1A2 isoform X1 [Myotis davidii]|uniref:solute carrier organic anion transporter family member 1A2 isoform X1 n=1 Tax=Myotis davidii TaxID=225400 RepID=UPI000766FD05|nr:PREDICTED: solute carrier organic anion transporter family member 1A2 isoform X1 [Myotis davidii]XP_015425573.1 PREDICTED: solute carrier organic anion transporter family member 1A2 isoform X1 [Myotis davidii]XP_015425574.1 PREDICTED: solute carrier organic anion transporter family member 1A2 isoform X1 [Myotis davidii]XP_015425575.1 PREDICTED: solute carrier organic anion transporter family member 1A2 isoform X1 [Myotis davidii]XP_015425576.1 PREDICTED: solute carrier organic anion transpor